MSERKVTERIVTGGCHCGSIRYRAVLREPVQALDCNCSICRMTGYLHINVLHSDVEITDHNNTLSTYRFGTGQALHTFCKVCGVKPFYQPRSHPDHWSLNARCIDGGIPQDIDFISFNGVDWEENIHKIK